MTILRGTGWVALALCLAGCNKPAATTGVAQNQNPGPDNAMTRYVENLQRDQQRAQSAADKANAAIAREQKQANQSMEPPQ
jgi:hypothetical protein